MENLEQSPSVVENVSTETTPVPPTPTADEKVKALETQLQAVRDEKERLEKGYKGLQTNLNKTNDELKRQVDLKREIAELKEQQKILATFVAHGRGSEENLDDIPQGKKQGLLDEYEKLLAKQDAERKQAEVKAKQEEYFKQADDVYIRAKALGLPEDDETLLDVEDLLKAGNLKRAELKVKKLEEARKVKEEPKKVESEAEIEARIRAKILAEFKTDTATPSGRTAGTEDIIKRYSQGDPSITHDDYLKATGRR